MGGGALRLFPVESKIDEDGAEAKIPDAYHTVSIPPAFNQLSFFAVQPGESFHDVEEVYHRQPGGSEDDGGRIRMAISGWFHIPQEGEEGYEEGLEEKLAEKSSLMQLQGRPDRYDLPQPVWKAYPTADFPAEAEDEEPELSEDDLNLLLRFIKPNYLTPDTVGELSEIFTEESSLQLSDFLSEKFSKKLREYLKKEQNASILPETTTSSKRHCGVARPPHKHRFLYRQPGCVIGDDSSPYDELLEILFPSHAFGKWLSLATGLTLSRCNILARRYRRGMDYTLATSYDQPHPQLEICLGITPTPGWGGDDQADEEDPDENGSAKAKGPATGKESESVGGYEVYMAADDDGGSEVDIPANAKPDSTNTGAGKRRGKADPAIYKSSADDDDEDGVLFSMPASWNTMSIVLRDQGVLRFVKYVSQAAKGDRLDICGEFGVVDDDDE